MLPPPLKLKSSYETDFDITGGTRRCHNNDHNELLQSTNCHDANFVVTDGTGGLLWRPKLAQVTIKLVSWQFWMSYVFYLGSNL